MFRLLLCLLLLIPLPVSAGIFDLPRSQPALFNAPLNNSQDFLPVDLAFGLDLIEADTDSIRLRFIMPMAITSTNIVSPSTATIRK